MVSGAYLARHRPETSVQTKAYRETRVSFNLAHQSQIRKACGNLRHTTMRNMGVGGSGVDHGLVNSRPEDRITQRGETVRHQFAGDISGVLKFAFLRALAGAGQTLGVAWYYAPGDDGWADGRHLECRDEPAWRLLDAQLHSGLSALSESSIAALEHAVILLNGALFHPASAPPRVERDAW